MKLSVAAELAIRGISVLASHYGEGPVTLSELCDTKDLPKQYLAKIFSSLSRADLVTPIRGKRGGYKLSHPPQEITLLQVIEAVEGPLAINLCQFDPPKCSDMQCSLRGVWSELQNMLRTKLQSVTLADCGVDIPSDPSKLIATAD